MKYFVESYKYYTDVSTLIIGFTLSEKTHFPIQR